MAGKIPSTSASDDSSRHRFRSDPMIPRDRPDSVRELKETLLHSKSGDLLLPEQIRTSTQS